VNFYGKGKIVTILPDAWSAARNFPDLVRDTIDFALADTGSERAADLIGTDARMDFAMEKLRDGFAVAIVNHNSVETEVTVRTLQSTSQFPYTWTDLVTGARIPNSDRDSLVRIPAGGFRAIEFNQSHAVKIASPPTRQDHRSE